MSLSLPGIDLFYLPKDNLTPEEYERIISPFAAWSHIERRYEFDDGWNGSHYLIRMREKNFYRSPNQPPPHGPREKARMKNMVEHGEVVMLNPFSGPAGLFYINDNGNLICTHSGAFAFSGADRVIREYQRSVDQRDYRRRDGKPRPTRKQAFTGTSGQNINPEPAGKTINSKAAGRLLAAGGIYNGNIAGFRQLAEQLGGEAPSGYEQVMNDQTKGLLITGASIAAGLGLGRLTPPNEVDTLSHLSKVTTLPPSELVRFSPQQLQKKFKHAVDFNVSGNPNTEGLASFKQALKAHIDSPTTTKITGKYRWSQDVYHYYNPETNLDIITNPNGDFISGWKLSRTQVADLIGEGNVF